MNDTQRIAALEAEVADLKRHDARRESEHRNVLRTYEETIASRDKLRRDVDADYTLLGIAIDKRIDELVARVATSGGGLESEALAALLHEIAKDTGAAVAEALAAQEARIMARVSAQFEKLATCQGNIGDAIDRLLAAQRGNEA